MIHEDDVEPDFYIDKADDATYVPDSPKHDKMTNLDDQEPELFDFDLEAEPML